MPNLTFHIPSEGQKISASQGRLSVPPTPIIPFIEGDGSGADIWQAARRVLDAAVEKAYQGQRCIAWMEVFAGEKAQRLFGTWLPEDTLTAFKEFKVGLKGPLTTPVGGGMRSLNVTLRQMLDLYVCQRPVRWFKGTPSPVLRPQDVNMVLFRENIEDLYAGIEFEQGSAQSLRFGQILQTEFPREYERLRFPHTTAYGIKPISKEGSTRLVRAAIRWALANGRKSVTLVHKGNIMKFTEGAFYRWGYELAQTEFAGQVYTGPQMEATRKQAGEEAATLELEAAMHSGKLFINDIITDAAFEQTLTHPTDFDVLATTNLNGDYLSDALSAQVGGLGMAPGANINYETGAAIFEATHGTAPKLAGLDVVNPGSLILSGEMLLRYLNWNEAADRVIHAMEHTIQNRTVTADLARLMSGAHTLKTSEFGDALITALDA